MLQLKNNSSDPFYNLAFEEYFTQKSATLGDSLIFFWRNRPSVIVGRFQNTFGEVDASVAKKRNVEVVRRITGGGAVYHDLNNLNYSFILPSTASEYLAGSKNESFDLLFDIILSLLARNGIIAEKSGRNDLLLDGKKISGAAKQITRYGLLLHGTLLFDVDLEVLSTVLNVDPAKYQSKGLASVRSRVTNLKEKLPAGMDISGFKAALEAELDCPEYLPAPEDLAAITALADNKYRDWNWTWGKSPEFTLNKSRRFGWGKLELRLLAQNGVIKDCRVYGDFFSNNLYSAEEQGDSALASGVRPLESALCGLRAGSPEMRRAMEKLPLADIFIGAEPDEVIDFFME